MSDRFRKLSHTIYECKYHIVMCPKYRYRIFKGEIAEYAKQQTSYVLKRSEAIPIFTHHVDHFHLAALRAYIETFEFCHFEELKRREIL